MKRSTGWIKILVGLLAVTLWLAGCAGGKTPAPSAGGGGPQPGGKVVFGFTYEPVTLDPHVSGQANAFRILRQVMDSYLWMDEKGNVHPLLAKSWEISPDGKVYTLKLREDVKFHDGTPLNAEAAKFSFDRIKDPKTMSQSAVGDLGPYYDRCEVVDPYTIKIYFKQSYAPFLTNLCKPSLSPVSPAAVEKYGADFGRHPVGCGPFMVKEWIAKDSVTLVKNPDYNWAPETAQHTGPALIDELVVKFVPESEVRVSALETGELTVVEGVPPLHVKRLKGDAKYTVYEKDYPGSARQVMINVSKFPTDDVRVRKAILYAIDRKSFVDKVHAGVYPLGSSIMGRGTWTYDPSLKDMYPYDPDKAKQLLDEAGWKPGPDGIRYKDGKPLKLVIHILAAVEDYPAMGEFIQGELKKVGMDVEINAMERSAWYEGNKAGRHNLVPMALWVADPDAFSMLYHSRGSAFSWCHLKDPEVDALFDKAAASTNRDERFQIYRQLQRMLMEKAVIVPMYDNVNLMAGTAKLKGLSFDLNAYPVFYDCYLEK